MTSTSNAKFGDECPIRLIKKDGGAHANSKERGERVGSQGLWMPVRTCVGDDLHS